MYCFAMAKRSACSLSVTAFCQEAGSARKGESALELGVKLFVVAVVVAVAVVVCFCFGGGGGGSQLWSCVVLFCGEWRRVSFRGAKGGESAGGQSASGAVKGEGGSVSFGVWCETVRRRRCAVCFCFWVGGRGRVSFRGCEGGRGASQLPGL